MSLSSFSYVLCLEAYLTHSFPDWLGGQQATPEKSVWPGDLAYGAFVSGALGKAKQDFKALVTFDKS